jgi:large subunit ribosomal protein L43
MSLKGVRQLKELTIRYCDIGGSSRGIREWIRAEAIPFAKENPTMQVTTIKKRNNHPFIQGDYLNGNNKVIGVKNLSLSEIRDHIFLLRNQIGRKVSFASGFDVTGSFFIFLLLFSSISAVDEFNRI